MKVDDALKLVKGSVVYLLGSGDAVTVESTESGTHGISGEQYVYIRGVTSDGKMIGFQNSEFTLKKAELTAEELAEFTVLNLVAFDLYRKDSQEKGVVPPCWLCMSVEAKEEARKSLFEAIRIKHFFPVDEHTFVNILPPNWGGPELARWKEAELCFKQMREDGNPRAFFAE